MERKGRYIYTVLGTSVGKNLNKDEKFIPA
jgi:hypothetical protein